MSTVMYPTRVIINHMKCGIRTSVHRVSLYTVGRHDKNSLYERHITTSAEKGINRCQKHKVVLKSLEY